MPKFTYEVTTLPKRKHNPDFPKNYVGEQMPFMWVVSDQYNKIRTYGYTHTRQQAENMAYEAYENLINKANYA